MAHSSMGASSLVARGYQQEMFERSMKGNVIIVLETGSGKTMIAAMRIRAELERCPHDKMAWFLCPGVDLCKQQHDFLSRFMPSIRTRLLIGSDNMDRWGQQRIWDAALDQIRLVVSTHAVLCQALEHSFVSLDRLALLVFDEAHHCQKKHPANRIMQTYYHPLKAINPSAVPHILGLSASPTTQTSLQKMHKVEGNLDAVCVAPRTYRTELERYVNRPVVSLLDFASDSNLQVLGNAMRALTDRFQAIRITDGVVGSPAASKDILRLLSRAEYILKVVGTWAAECFIIRTLEALAETMQASKYTAMNRDHEDAMALLALRDVEGFQDTLNAGQRDQTFGLTAKATRLVEYLAEHVTGSTKCLIFVERRDMTHVLCWLLNVHAATSRHFRAAPYVGISSSPAHRPGLVDLVNSKEQKHVLERFKADEIDILIATSAAEEGIDVQACNLVICFDPPANLRAFVQRRGRARQHKSTLALLTPSGDHDTKLYQWQAIEAEMIRECQEERLVIPQVGAHGIDEAMDLKLVHPQTGAIIHEDNVVSHLYHFCSLLPQHAYVDLRPDFTYELASDGKIWSYVRLPDFIGVTATFRSEHGWLSEQAARKDAAFQAYRALYETGLLNEHLLPLSQDWDLLASDDNAEPRDVDAKSQFSPWHQHTRAEDSVAWYHRGITIRTGELEMGFLLATPINIPEIPAMTIRRFSDDPCLVTFGITEAPNPGLPDVHLQMQCTAALYQLSRSYRLAIEPQHLLCMLSPVTETYRNRLVAAHDSAITAAKAQERGDALPLMVRAPLPNRPVFLAHSWSATPGQPLTVRCTRLTRHGNVRHLFDNNIGSSKGTSLFLASECTVQDARYEEILTSILLPSIFYHLTDYMTAQRLQEMCLPDVRLNNLGHVVEAIRAPAANRASNYQRLEFVGDCVLKFVCSQHLFAAHPAWHQGYLSQKRANITSNEVLAAQALRTGIDEYIITDQTNFRDWILPTRSNKPMNPRILPTKTLADVVEALIGAVFVESNMQMAPVRACISHLIPELPENDPPLPSKPLIPFAALRILNPMEGLIGYTFKNKLLCLEAVTLSSSGSTTHTQSYQRLEFLGDAVLDLLVLRTMLKHRSPLSQGQMTCTRAAMVNSHLLGFLCMHLQQDEEAETVITEEDTGHFYIGNKLHSISIWQFMRHHSEDITLAQTRCQERYELQRAGIQKDLSGDSYPWLGLASLNPAKFFSDLVESLLGAIFIDSDEDLDSCAAFLEKIGLLRCVKHVLEASIDVVHPRDRLQRLAGSQTVNFDVRMGRDRLWHGSLSIGDNLSVRVAACQTEEVAILQLCLDGIDILHGAGAKDNVAMT